MFFRGQVMSSHNNQPIDEDSIQERWEMFYSKFGSKERLKKIGCSDELFHQNYMQPLICESLIKPDLNTRKQWAGATLDFYATGKTSNQLDATEIMKYFLLTWTIEGKLKN